MSITQDFGEKEETSAETKMVITKMNAYLVDAEIEHEETTGEVKGGTKIDKVRDKKMLEGSMNKEVGDSWEIMGEALSSDLTCLVPLLKDIKPQLMLNKFRDKDMVSYVLTPSLQGGTLLLELKASAVPPWWFTLCGPALPVYQKRRREDVEIWEGRPNLLGLEPTSNERALSKDHDMIIHSAKNSDIRIQLESQSFAICVDFDAINISIHSIYSSKCICSGMCLYQACHAQSSHCFIRTRQADILLVDYQHWKRVVTQVNLNGIGINWSAVANAMDMRGHLWGRESLIVRDNVKTSIVKLENMFQEAGIGFLPIANVDGSMEKGRPRQRQNLQAAKGDRPHQECVSESSSFVTGEASDNGQQQKRKDYHTATIYLWAINDLAFEDYGSIPPHPLPTSTTES
nr:nuclear transcription factor Y subunit B-2 [Ipomoea batatas]